MTAYAIRLANGQDTAERMRRADALGLTPSGPGLARPGLRNDGGGAVTVVAGSMDVQVAPFSAWVDGGVSDTQGGYSFVLDASVTLTLTAGHATLARVDTIVAEVRDDLYDASGFTDARVRVVEGTPGAGAPALPSNCLPLRDVNVPAGLSAGTGGLASGNLGTDRRSYTSGLGGVVTVAGATERDALPQVNGTLVYRVDTGQVEVRKAAGWVTMHAADNSPRGILSDTYLTADIVGVVGDTTFMETPAFTSTGNRRIRLDWLFALNVSASSTGIFMFPERQVNGASWTAMSALGGWYLNPNSAGSQMCAGHGIDTPPAGSVKYRLRAQGHLANGQTIGGTGKSHFSLSDVGAA